MGKILVVEDDKKISRILKLQLERENHEIVIIENGIDALNEIDKKREFYDLILLDLGLPLMEGNEVCKNVRKISEVPIIVISAKNNIEEKVDLLKSGASDYVTKPFDFLELDARININIRKEKISQVVYKNLKLNMENYSVFLDDEPILLTKTEFELVKLLIENKEEIVSRDKIIEKIWGWEASDNLLDSTMKKIRQKLGKEKIKTVRGIGYILKI
ncbi:winged helix family two component transcriptional regulator [Leptotrichia shahii]|uniref:Winged helix family two component transcriptional regulator n=1 Tax=Leptotrichia shahii TaxID=157691 RepID=A0A510JQH2_9FUSO|nr:response regulator transcription factor [Leptotrichia shahii]BBM40615.1 winged helix family two component transcriptional regulator [Leptotrichia shahii]